METITIPNRIIKNDDLVIMPRKHYEIMMANLIPAIYLKGKTAQKLDRRVTRAIKECRAGKTRTINSLREIC